MEFRNQYTPSPPELRQNANNRTMWFAQYGRDGTFTVKTKRRRREPMTDGPRAVQKRILNADCSRQCPYPVTRGRIKLSCCMENVLCDACG